jgi:hypothetical protein
MSLNHLEAPIDLRHMPSCDHIDMQFVFTWRPRPERCKVSLDWDNEILHIEFLLTISIRSASSVTVAVSLRCTFIGPPVVRPSATNNVPRLSMSISF